MDEPRAWNYCLWLLGRRAHSRAELQEKLERKGTEADTVQRVLDRLEGYGYVNDRSFADQFVNSRSRRYGSLRLRGELLRKGIAEELVEEQLSGLSSDSQREAALALLEKNAWRFNRGDDPRRNRARAWSFLARRGFPPPAAGAALEEFASHNDLSEGPQGDEEPDG